MTRLIAAATLAAPSLIWIDGILPVPYLDPSGRGSFFPGPLTPAFVHGDPRLEDGVPRKVTDPNHVVVGGDVVCVDASACPVHSQCLRSSSSLQDQRSTKPWDKTTLTPGHFVPNSKNNRSTCV